MSTQKEIEQSEAEVKVLPLYTCHKKVRAAKIAGAELLVDGAATARIDLANDSPSAVYVDSEWLMTRVRSGVQVLEGMQKEEAIAAALEKAIGGYYVVYDGGHSSWSPAEAFEGGYTPHFDQEPVDVAEATLSVRDDDDEESYWPESAANMAFTRIENGHPEGVDHADIVMNRVIDMSSAEEKQFYALFMEGNPAPITYLEVQCGTFTEVGVNGFTLENLLAVVIDRLTLFQASEFKCQENKMAIFHATRALEELNARTAKRIERGVEGTTQV